MVERLICIQEVLGSNPCISTIGEMHDSAVYDRAQGATEDCPR